LLRISIWTPERVEQLRQSATAAAQMTEQLREFVTQACERAEATVTTTRASREARRQRAENLGDDVSPSNSPPGSRPDDPRAVDE
jgi:hypothetical protein